MTKKTSDRVPCGKEVPTRNGNNQKGLWQRSGCFKVCVGVVLIVSVYLLKTCYYVFYQPKGDQVTNKFYSWMYSWFGTYTANPSVTVGPFHVRVYNTVLNDLYSFVHMLGVIYDGVADFVNAITTTFFKYCFVTLVVGVITWFVFCGAYRLVVNRISRHQSDGEAEKSEKTQHNRGLGWILVKKPKQDNKNVDIGTRPSANQPIITISLRRIWSWLPELTVIAFLVTIPWEFMRLYQFKTAEKIAYASKGMPAECLLENMTYMQYIKSFLRWQFSWSSDACVQCYTAVHVSPVWEVSPLLVLTSVFSNCIIYPLENLSAGFGRAFRLFFSEIPMQWQAIMLIVFLLIALLVLMMVFKYRINLPFFKFEPKTPVSVADQSNRNKVTHRRMDRQVLGSERKALEYTESDGSHDNDISDEEYHPDFDSGPESFDSEFD